MVSKLFRPVVLLDLNIKSFANAELSLGYNPEQRIFLPAYSDKVTLQASQFLKTITFQIPGVRETRNLQLKMNNRHNVIIVEKMSVILKGVTYRDTLMTWYGSDVRNAFAEVSDIKLPSENRVYLQINTGANDPFILFNEKISKIVEEHSAGHKLEGAKILITTLLISLFICITVFYFMWPWLNNGAVFSAIKHAGILPLGFGLFIFFIFINNSLELVPDKGSQENRAAAKRPELRYDTFFDFPDEYSKYARDHFSFRNFLFYVNSLMRVKVFKTSPLPSDVIVGKNGWFFYNEIGSMADTRRFADVSPAELHLISNSLMQKKNWLEKRGVKFYVIVPPNKDRIYPEYLPDDYFITNIGSNRLDLYKEHLWNNYKFRLIDPTDSLLAAKKRRDVYYTTDTHWNLFGGFKGYQVLMNEVVKDFPHLKPLKEEDFLIHEEVTTEGDIAGLISLQKDFTRTEIHMQLRDTSKQLIPATTSEIFIPFTNNKTIDSSELKVIVFRDSYCNYLTPFLNVHFKDAIYVWSYEFMEKMIEEEKPDVVIFESLQRFMAAAFLLPNSKGVE